ncbi:MAG: class I SAM-dependent methyltransferase [Planctomycetes bacterium]|nr:class I SAM-dependent methyltransferase [Planctomycetota bacterium]
MFSRRRVRQAGLWAMVILGAWLAANGGERKPDVHYVPTPQEVVDAMLQTAGVGRDDIVYDLGCGDGRLVITAIEKFGAKKGVGIDIDPERIRDSSANARKANLTDRATFLEQDLYETEFSEATVVTLYLLPKLNVRLRPMLFRQLRPGDRIVSHAFDMEEWEADKTIQVPGEDQQERTVYYWVLPGGAAGAWKWTLPGAKGEQCQLRLRQRFQAVSGTVKIDGQEQPIADAKLAGDRLTFAIVREAGKDKAKMLFSGRIIGNTLVGTVETEGGPAAGKHEWTATRDRVNLVGTWGWKMGEQPATLRIERRDGRLYGALSTAEKAQVRLAHFYAWGNGIYFIHEGGTRQTFEGIVEGEGIAGTVTPAGGEAKEWAAQRTKK